MFKNIPPYQRIGWYGSIALVITVAYYYQFRVGELSGFWDAFFQTLMIGFSAAVLLMAALEISTLIKDYRSGYLFPMRNATFFVVCLSVIALPVIGLYQLFGGEGFHPSTVLLIPVFLWMCVRNLFRVKIDHVSFMAKTGFRPPLEVPLFRIASVTEDDRGINITTDEGKEVRLLRPFFFPVIWENLRERLSALG